MKKLKTFKKEYESIEIPQELSTSVEDILKGNSHTRFRRKNLWKYPLSITAAASLCFFTLLNSSETFAKGVMDIPVIGNIAKVLTIRSYMEKENNRTITVNVPEISVDESNPSKAKEPLQKAVTNTNAAIKELVDNYITDAAKRMDEYKEAFLATGGTEAEWEDRNFAIDVDYKVACQNEKYLSVILTANESWCSAYGINYYYNLDLENGKILSLEDLLGEDYINIVNASVKQQIKERMESDENNIYFAEEEGGFTTINKETKFYVNKAGATTVVFDKYEIAPGYMGIQEFEITK